MRFLDTNILLRYFTRDDESKARDVLELLQRVERAEERVVTSQLVIFETIFTLESFYEVPRERILELLDTILELIGLSVENKGVFQSALRLYSGTSISFADAFNACYMEKKNIAEIYSYDRDFDSLEGITRVEP